MKRFLVFAYMDYYPEGGLNDLRGDFDFDEGEEEYYMPLRAEIEKVDLQRKYDVVEVLDTKTGDIY